MVKFKNINEALEFLKNHKGVIYDKYGNKFYLETDYLSRGFDIIGYEQYELDDDGSWYLSDVNYYREDEFLEFADELEDMDGEEYKNS